jgi:hypothetical protein
MRKAESDLESLDKDGDINEDYDLTGDQRSRWRVSLPYVSLNSKMVSWFQTRKRESKIVKLPCLA